MPRSWKAILPCVFLVLFLAIGFGAGPVRADTYLITAVPTSWGQEWGWHGFSLQYTDLDGDGSFSLNELVPGSFAGVRESDGTVVQTRAFYRYIGHAPFLGPDFPSALKSDGPHWAYGELPDDAIWVFASWDDRPVYPQADLTRIVVEGHEQYDATPAAVLFWGYTQTPVPLPPSVYLLGAGLIGLAAARRKKRLGP